jgi:IS30 family transposase
MKRLSTRRDVRRQFWLLIRAGVIRTEAAKRSGLHKATGERWFSQAGGVVPPYVCAQPTGRQLSFAEREEISVGVASGQSINFIARALNRAPSTVLRELRRNHQQYRSRWELDSTPKRGGRRTLPWNYRAGLAQKRADQAASRPKLSRLATNQRLHDLVQTKLEELLSPEQIAAQLRRRFPKDAEMRVSHETIYQSFYVQGRGALRRELAVCLRTGRALRKPRRRSQERRGRIPGMVNISERPAEVEDRAVPGHWEGDLIMGKHGRSAIGTLVERSSRYLMLLHLPNGGSATEVESAMAAATKRLPQTLWKTLTWDQGNEMRNHAEISVSTGLEIYFCDPASPWQRGSNENTNGLLRQYFPKGTDLKVHQPEYLEFVSAQMNRRPRKTLDWLNPAEALQQLLSPSPSQPTVATTD